uniref:Uncharacterized protein n=1 Tax=Picea glauca TaxID=3330 RepID=A0A101M1R7_PICGL|nr:hypothetical protein ABT39_MTgene4002 [Picea glauca]
MHNIYTNTYFKDKKWNIILLTLRAHETFMPHHFSLCNKGSNYNESFHGSSTFTLLHASRSVYHFDFSSHID